MSNKILVLGSTGKTGKRIADKLEQLKCPVVRASRNATPSFNWDEPDNWSQLLKDIDQVYISFQPDLAVPHAAEKIRLFTEKAREQKVRKLVLLSGRGEKEAAVSEGIVMTSGIDWTILRASWFMQNFSEGFFLDSILSSELVLPVLHKAEPFIDVDDLADVAVASLTSALHSHKIYELTGPELLTFKGATGIIAAKLNRPILVSEVSMDEYISMLRSFAVPEDFIWLIRYLFTELLDGRNELLTNDVEKILGRKPSDFRDYVTKTLNSGIWTTQLV